MVNFVENELVNIKTEVNDMWTLVYQQLDNAYKSLLNIDLDLADKVISREKRVNAFELKIDSDIEDFIALYNPVAIDLRFALAMLKINTNLERIGDYADSIARFLLRTELKPEDKTLFAELQLQDMFDTVLQMLSSTYDALQKHDITLAKTIFDKDETLDVLNKQAIDKLATYAAEHYSASWSVPETTSTIWPKRQSSILMPKYSSTARQYCWKKTDYSSILYFIIKS